MPSKQPEYTDATKILTNGIDSTVDAGFFCRIMGAALTEYGDVRLVGIEAEAIRQAASQIQRVIQNAQLDQGRREAMKDADAK